MKTETYGLAVMNYNSGKIFLYRIKLFTEVEDHTEIVEQHIIDCGHNLDEVHWMLSKELEVIYI